MRIFLAILRLLPIVAGTSLAAVLGLWAVREGLAPHLQNTNDTVGNYLQTVGTIYAVLLAFVATSVWSQFNETRSLLDSEANEVIDLFRAADGFPGPARDKLQAALGRYVERVLGEEWKAMANGDHEVSEAVVAELDAVWDDLHVFEPQSACVQSLHAEALARYNDLSDARTRRLTSARLRIPLPLKILLYVGATIVIGSMYLFQVDDFMIHAIMTGAVAGAISHILYLVWDLDNPFAGSWVLSPEPFRRVQRYIERRRA
jgi:hypothetical protein